MRALAVVGALVLIVGYGAGGLTGLALTTAFLTVVAGVAFATWLFRLRPLVAIAAGVAIAFPPALLVATLAYIGHSEAADSTRTGSFFIWVIFLGLPLAAAGVVGGLIGGSLAEGRKQTHA